MENEETNLEELLRKMNYYDIQFSDYDSFDDEHINIDCKDLVKNVINELLEATKNKEDLFYKKLKYEIKNIENENELLKEKIKDIKKIIGN